MLRHKPLLTYSGLTVVLSNPSRFDTTHLLSANGGCFLNQECLQPHNINVHQCDIRLKDDNSTYLPGTKCVLLLGKESAELVNKENTLNEIRGSPFIKNDIVHIPSYFPQDAVDIKNYEDSDSNEDNEPSDEDDSEKSRKNKTRRSNYRFWLSRDVDKAIKICKIYNGKIPKRLYEPEYCIWPNSNLIIEKLTKTKNRHLFFDIETDENNHILCFSFSFGINEVIYCVPVLDHNYHWAYSNLHHIFRALAISIRDNILVAHNGANYDFLWLGYHYRIPIYKVEDTMLMEHRCFPAVEKSLGHSISLWTWEQFHKDEGQSGYNNAEQVRQKLLYNGKDVFGMVLVHDALWKYAKTIPGLVASFNQVNASIKPYLICTLNGIEYDGQKVIDIKRENDRLMMQYLRIIHLLVGSQTINTLKKRFKSALPSSNPQCVEYFHNMLGYATAGKGKPSKINGERKPSLAKKNIYKLRIKYGNPVIDFVIAYRACAHETGLLKFNSWQFRNDRINNNPTNNHTPIHTTTS